MDSEDIAKIIILVVMLAFYSVLGFVAFHFIVKYW